MLKLEATKHVAGDGIIKIEMHFLADVYVPVKYVAN